MTFTIPVKKKKETPENVPMTFSTTYWILYILHSQPCLLILYVCPLTKKWSVYHFNGRFIWTVRERTTTTKIQKNAFQKSYKLICVLMSQISIWTFAKHDFVLGGKTLVGDHRVQTFLVVGHQVCTHLRRDFVPLLFAEPLQFIKVSRLTFGNSNLQLPPQIFYGMKVWSWLGHSRTLICFFLRHSFVALAVCFGSLSCCNTHPRPIFNALAGFNALTLTWPRPSSLWCSAVVLSP